MRRQCVRSATTAYSPFACSSLLSQCSRQYFPLPRLSSCVGGGLMHQNTTPLLSSSISYQWKARGKVTYTRVKKKKNNHNNNHNGAARKPRTPMAKVLFGNEEVRFRIPPGEYSTEQLLKDCLTHWKPAIDHKLFYFSDEEGCIWPASAVLSSVGQDSKKKLFFRLRYRGDGENEVREKSEQEDHLEDEEDESDEELEGEDEDWIEGQGPKNSASQRKTSETGFTETERDMLSLKLEGFSQSATARQELRQLILSRLPHPDEVGIGKKNFKEALDTGVSVLAGRILATFEIHVSSDSVLNSDYLPPSLKRMLLDARSNDEDCFAALLPLLLEFAKDKFLSGTQTDNLKKVFTEQQGANQILSAMADLRYPHKWYEAARRVTSDSGGRKIIFHVGPTNSGKTYEALQRLQQAKSGLYCGPLRLLAEEIYRRMNEEHSVPCTLLTGQRIVQVPEAKHIACTVEMADIHKEIECAVIDEIQMLGDRDRGWAWSRALLGIPAKEVHLCGNESVLEIVKAMCASTGETLEIKQYDRLSPLEISPNPLGGAGASFFRYLKKGDCVIAFSREKLHTLKREIEKKTKFRCCIVYGGLPPETRVKQAELFNSPFSKYDVLVASDAIGMGLNLNIKRIVFTTLEKFDGEERRKLTHAEIKQIAGRAGRFKSQYPIGEVACITRKDSLLLQKALFVKKLPQLKSAGLAATYDQLVLFSRALPRYKFSEILDAFNQIAAVDKNFFMCPIDDSVEIAKRIDSVPLTLRERYKFCTAPVNTDHPVVMQALYTFAKNHSTYYEVPLNVKYEVGSNRSGTEELADLEAYHHILDLYLWLSYRFDSFVDREKAEEEKTLVEAQIQRILLKHPKSEHTEYMREVRDGRGGKPGYKRKKKEMLKELKRYRKMMFEDQLDEWDLDDMDDDEREMLRQDWRP